MTKPDTSFSSELLTPRFDLPWVPEVIFLARLRERAAAEPLQRGAKRREEKNNLWLFFSSPLRRGSLSLNLAKKITSGTQGSFDFAIVIEIEK